MKLGQILSFCLLGLTFTSFGQNAYYFKPWKSNEVFDNNNIFFKIDTSGSSDETKILLIIASKIDDNLNPKGIKTHPIPFPADTIIDNNTLCLKLENLKMAYVKLNTLGADMPLCFRIRVTQTQPQTKRMISTDISISVDKKQQGVDEVGVAIAERLLRHFKLTE